MAIQTEPERIQSQRIIHIHRHSAPIYDDAEALIKQLKQENEQLKNYIMVLENKKSYLKHNDLKDVVNLFYEPQDKNQIRQYYNETKATTNQWAITLTIAPAKFPQLPLVPQKAQIKYFTDVLSHLSQKDLIGPTYGCFEAFKNGNIHCHFITATYCIDSFIKKVQKYLTDKIIQRKQPYYYYSTVSCCVKTMPTTEDLNKWIDYIEKDPVELFTSIPNHTTNLDL